jgi:nucleotide-binding universal stress UspA family protein
MRVVLALDNSKDAKEAVSFVARLPFRQKPSVTLVTALSNFPFGLTTTEALDSLAAAEKQQADKNFQYAKELLANYCSGIEHVVELSHPRQLILEVAKNRQADLVVVGAQGHSAAYRVVLGSIADYVANHAPCSVLIVRHAESKPTTPAKPEFRILVAYDASVHSQMAFAQLQEFEWPKDQSLIHLSMMVERPNMLPTELVYDPQLLAESAASLKELVSQAKLACPVTHSVRETLHVGNALSSQADGDEFNLLFAGSSGKSGLSRLFLGSTSRYLLHHAKCSVWIAREKKW